MEKNSFDLLAKFGHGDVTLVRVEVREQTLSRFRCFYGHEDMMGPRKIGKHDFIILTVIDRTHKPFSFVAEKIHRNLSLCSGYRYYICMVPLSEHSSASSPSRSRFIWELHNQIVPTTELNRILTSSGDHYNLFSDNCWRYASRIVENVLGLCLCQSLRMRDLNGVRCRLEGLCQLETVKRPLPQDVLRLLYKPLSRRTPTTLSKIANWWNRCSVASSCSGNCDTDCGTDCHTVEVVLNLCLRHWPRMDDPELAQDCDTLEAVLELCLRELQRLHNLKLE